MSVRVMNIPYEDDKTRNAKAREFIADPQKMSGWLDDQVHCRADFHLTKLVEYVTEYTILDLEDDNNKFTDNERDMLRDAVSRRIFPEIIELLEWNIKELGYTKE